MGEKLSSAEAELYDRQIRLWGIESQEKLRAANVLLINIRGLGSEVAKDILLSGINSLTILDSGVVTVEDLTKNFLLDRTAVGKKLVDAVLHKAQALNPLVKVIPDPEDVANKKENYFQQFTIVVGTCLNSESMIKISTICRNNNIKFICGDIFGMFGFTISDFQNHEYYEDQVKLVVGKKRSHDGKPNNYERISTKVTAKITFPPLEKVITIPEFASVVKRRNPLYFLALILLDFRNQYGRDPSYEEREEDLVKLLEIRNKILKFFQVDKEKLKIETFELLFGELVTIASIVGGVISQEVIKAVSHKEVPITNMFLLDPFTYNGREEAVSVAN